MPILTLLTDFGLDDYYVAAVKGVILSLAPGTILVDLCHSVPPGDVELAGHLLAAAAPRFPPGTVHLAVVDPGVGSARRLLLAEGAEACYLAPDNGLLTPLFPACPTLRAADRPDLYLPGPGQTFHGRDRFAPLAAALLRGEPPASLGPAISDPVRWAAPPPRRETSGITGRIVQVDRFGNLITDIPSAWLPGSGWIARIAGNEVRRRVACYAEIPAGEAALLEGSRGTLEVSLRGADLARHWHAARGMPVRIFWNKEGCGPE